MKSQNRGPVGSLCTSIFLHFTVWHLSLALSSACDVTKMDTKETARYWDTTVAYFEGRFLCDDAQLS